MNIVSETGNTGKAFHVNYKVSVWRIRDIAYAAEFKTRGISVESDPVRWSAAGALPLFLLGDAGSGCASGDTSAESWQELPRSCSSLSRHMLQTTAND
jgi:hypothetical protein